MRERVIKVLTLINPKIADCLEVDLLEAGLIDSFEMVNLVMELENEFEIEIDPEDIIPDNFKTIETIVKLLEKTM